MSGEPALELRDVSFGYTRSEMVIRGVSARVGLGSPVSRAPPPRSTRPLGAAVSSPGAAGGAAHEPAKGAA